MGQNIMKLITYKHIKIKYNIKTAGGRRSCGTTPLQSGVANLFLFPRKSPGCRYLVLVLVLVAGTCLVDIIEDTCFAGTGVGCR